MQSDRITLRVACFGESLAGRATSANDRRALAFAVRFGAISGDTGRVHGPDENPPCHFCGERDATDVYREDGYPDAPCCADEDACHARVLAL